MSHSLQPHRLQHSRFLCPLLSPGFCSNSYHLSGWYPTISSSVIPSSSHLQSFPTLGDFAIRQLFASGSQSIRASASALVLSMNIQGWFPLGLTSLISWKSKEVSRVFSSTTVQKHQFFGAQSYLCSNSHIHMWLLENHSFDHGHLLAKWCLCFLIYSISLS